MGKIVDKTVFIHKDAIVEDGVKIWGKSRIENGSHILSGSVIIDSIIGENTIVENSKIKGSIIGKNCKIGPFSNIRENCFLNNNIKVGSFVEIKNSKIGNFTKIPHLAYIGDAEIGDNTNVGCGVIFANYNGKIKQKSIVGNNVFIGCNVNIIAPVYIADKSYICAGTTVTMDTKNGDFVIGRVRQENKKRV